MSSCDRVLRALFVQEFQGLFDALFEFDFDGACVARHRREWELFDCGEMRLMAWSYDLPLFEETLRFVYRTKTPERFVLTEVETLERFTESYLVSPDGEALRDSWYYSTLPHFLTAMFDRSGTWCALFDNDNDHAKFYRRPLG
jgi:hypothetical protein